MLPRYTHNLPLTDAELKLLLELVRVALAGGEIGTGSATDAEIVTLTALEKALSSEEI